MGAQEAAPAFEGADGRRVVILFAVVTTIVAGFFAARIAREYTGDAMSMSGMPGMETSKSPRGLGVDAFASHLGSPGVFVVNVHKGGALIAGTDASIASDSIVGNDELPRDPATPIALYCRTGRMSRQAARALQDAGFQNVTYLAGGTDAWAATGRTLE